MARGLLVTNTTVVVIVGFSGFSTSSRKIFEIPAQSCEPIAQIPHPELSRCCIFPNAGTAAAKPCHDHAVTYRTGY
ncbi:hypothetical protein POX_d05161 [Penicillium oxalicum]|nr:hypothetical protein POX_d05161 [Penicillium oxalicum]KAI2789666.1 hypothetical protein POX_d05161 [Penicillium oxalicum]